jgi:carboxyl-terminal processing protease
VNLRSRTLPILFLFAAGWSLGRSAEDSAAAPTPVSADSAAAVRSATFTEVWQTVNDAYFDPQFGGVDWAQVREKYRAKLEHVTSNAELRELLQAMLNELHRSHFAILAREAAVFQPSERPRIGTIGAGLADCDGSVVVAQVIPDSPAAREGLKPGEAIETVDGYELTAIRRYLNEAGMSDRRQMFLLTEFVAGRLQSPVGTKVSLRVKDAQGQVRTVDLTCTPHTGIWSEPIGNFPSLPVEIESRHLREGVEYLRFNVFTPQLMKEIKAFLVGMKEGDGLVLDLRGNPGGVVLMAPGISGWLSHTEFSLGTMRLRQGFLTYNVFPQAHAFLGPVAILIDGRSASTSELLAAGMQEAHRARIFGETSVGAALPSSFKTLPSGDIFQYAMAEIQTPSGRSIEGRGVEPDETVALTRADLAAGRDPVLAAAQAWLIEARRKPTPPATAAVSTP